MDKHMTDEEVRKLCETINQCDAALKAMPHIKVSADPIFLQAIDLLRDQSENATVAARALLASMEDRKRLERDAIVRKHDLEEMDEAMLRVPPILAPCLGIEGAIEAARSRISRQKGEQR